MSQILIEKINGVDVFESLQETWRQLFAVSDCAPFLSPEWMAEWHEKLGPERETYVLKASRNDNPIGILPFCLETKKVLGVQFRRLGFLGSELGGADYLDLIAKDEDKAEIWARVFDFLRDQKDFDSISLDNLAQDSKTVSIIENLCQADRSFRIKKTSSSVCPQINLESGWENVLRESKRKDNFKRRLKKLEKMPDFEFRSVTSEADVAAAFERFAFLHEKRWEKDGGSEATGLPQLMSFHRAAVGRLAASNLVRFDELWVEGSCRASIYGLDNGRTFYYFNAGYDLDWAGRSVGLVLIGLSIQAAITRGVGLYDFLRGAETYKFDWSNSTRELASITLNRPNFLVSLHQASEDLRVFARLSAKSLLPDQTALRFQNVRRNWLRNRRAREV